MAKKESKILEELRRRGKILEDPAPTPGGLTGWLIDLFTKDSTKDYRKEKPTHTEMEFNKESPKFGK